MVAVTMSVLGMHCFTLPFPPSQICPRSHSSCRPRTNSQGQSSVALRRVSQLTLRQLNLERATAHLIPRRVPARSSWPALTQWNMSRCPGRHILYWRCVRRQALSSGVKRKRLYSYANGQLNVHSLDYTQSHCKFGMGLLKIQRELFRTERILGCQTWHAQR